MENEPLNYKFLTAEPDFTAPPIPASQHVPEWLKQMPPEVICTKSTPLGPNGSLKKCMPFLDAMTAGYLIPVAGDVQLYMIDEKTIEIVSPDKAISAQNPETFPGAPFGPRIVLKFLSKWVVQTPPGYSTLFLPLINKFDYPFQILAGLVETDKYYNEIHFPAVCLLRAGQAFKLDRGTPIVQAIPIKRDAWQHTLGETDAAKHDSIKAELKSNTHMYRDENWEKKTWR